MIKSQTLELLHITFFFLTDSKVRERTVSEPDFNNVSYLDGVICIKR